MESNSFFRSIVITSPDHMANEQEMVRQLILSGAADYVHIRKPGWSKEKTAAFLQSFDKSILPKLRIHDHYELANHFPIAGIQLNARNAWSDFDNFSGCTLSCHSLEEVKLSVPELDYVTLSPVFDSISKSGYKSSHFPSFIDPDISKKHRIVALGGIEPRHFEMLANAGYWGASMLGYVWHNPLSLSFNEIIDEILLHRKTIISSLKHVP